MNGELSQMIWLTSAVNGFLCQRLDPVEFFPANPVFHHCLSVQFQHDRGLLGGRRISDDPRTWMAHLRQSGATRASLLPGEVWSILIDCPDQREHWTAHWESRHKDGVNEKVWSVLYRRTHHGNDDSRIPAADLAADTKTFDAALISIRHFCIDRKLHHWSDIFQRALDSLHGQPLFPENVQPVCLEDYPLEAQRLLAACYHAWVFGPMSSWSDMVFERSADNQTHDSLSRLVQEQITKVVPNAVNSYQARK